MRKLWWLLLVVALLAGGYYWMAVDSRMPADADFALDLAELRRLAAASPGAKPRAIHYELVSTFVFPRAMVTAGDDWSTVPIPAYVYRVDYPDRTVLIDAAMPRAIAMPEFMVAGYDDAAWRRTQEALGRAALIVITHEHMDHIGGVAAYPDLKALLPALRLTEAQLAHPERMKPAELPMAPFAGYQSLRYEGMHALAPGLVLVAAPGHTPGSQMVYVQLADGKELLFLGDVVWQMRNIEVRRERPRWATALIREDRHAVFGQIKALHALSQSNPEVKLVPGHDGAVIEALTGAGYLRPGF